MSNKIYLIDGNSFIYRMFFGLPEFSTSKWKVVNATFWMAKFFLKQLKTENPEYLIFIKDAKWENFRHQLYSDYKATREKMPDNLRSQISDIENFINSMGIDIVEIQGYEADDVIWTLAKKLSVDKNNQIYILTGDKDLYSLVNENTFIYDTQKWKVFDLNLTNNKFNLKSPELIIDYLAIVWDKADNIPWIEWFWPKKAEILINNIWTVEEIYNFLDNWIFDCKWTEVEKIFKWKTIEKLISSRENAFLSKKLATIHTNVYLDDFKIDNFKFKDKNLYTEEVEKLLEEFEFKSLYNKQVKTKKWSDLNLDVNIIDNEKWILKLQEILKLYDKIVIDTETSSLNIQEAIIQWISLYLDDKNIFYINLNKLSNISQDTIKTFIVNLLNSNKTLIGHNLKYDLEIIESFINTNKSQWIINKNSNWQICLEI